MDENHLKPESTSATCLSVPNTPTLMSTRRGSGVQMSAKLAALMGENHDPNVMREKSDRTVKYVRFMQKNGRCNIKQEATGILEKYLKDFFTTLVDMKWRNNVLFYIATYVIAWSLFGFLWYLIALIRGDIMDRDEVNNATANKTRVNCVDQVYSYTTAFLFFVETETSIGYGKRAITEECPEAIILFVLQALLGNVLDAFMIGCIFIKISQPKNRAETLVFSDKCVIAPRDKVYCLMFRVGNLRNSLMVQCRIRAKLVKARQTQEGEFLALHQDDINIGYDTGADNLFLVTPLIISHEIGEKSPFYRMSSKDLEVTRFEIIVILEGMIESTGMICQARTSYTNEEISWGQRFAPVVEGGGKHYFVDHSTFNNYLQSDMPKVSMYEFEEDVKLNGENSPYYKYVQERNIQKFSRARQQTSRRIASEVVDIEKRDQGTSSRLSGPLYSVSVGQPRRALSEINVSIAELQESSRPKLHSSNSETLTRLHPPSNRDDLNERRWSSAELDISLLNNDMKNSNQNKSDSISPPQLKIETSPDA